MRCAIMCNKLHIQRASYDTSWPCGGEPIALGATLGLAEAAAGNAVEEVPTRTFPSAALGLLVAADHYAGGVNYARFLPVWGR